MNGDVWRSPKGAEYLEMDGQLWPIEAWVRVSTALLECRHGVPLDHNCNACSDDAAVVAREDV